MSAQSDAVEARSKQSAASKRATLSRLTKKTRAEREVSVSLPDGEGGQDVATLLFRALGAQDYDKLLGKHPPTAQQRLEGHSYNLDTFGPALLSRVCVDPEMTEDEAKAIWTSGEWSRGEIMTLFGHAVEICNQGMDVPFGAGG